MFECPLVMRLTDAREKLEDWRRHYKKGRPHSAIGYNGPIAMHYPDGVTHPSSGDSAVIPENVLV